MDAPKRPTMPDVAERAGVSLKTVSRVINNESGVAPETVERVREAIVELGFRRNDVARNLRTGASSATIGFVIGDVGNPFYSAMHRAIERAASGRDLLVVAGSTEEVPDREQDLILELCRRRVEGLLIVPTGADHRYLEVEIDMGTQVVALDRPLAGLDVDTVTLDNTRSVQRAVGGLIGEGHRRIAALTSSGLHAPAERLTGYQRALADAGIGQDPDLVVDLPQDPLAAAAATGDLLDLDEPPTAIFTANNRLTIGVVRALLERGAELEVLGFDDFELSESLPLPIRVLAHDPAEMGSIGAKLLFERLDGFRRRPRRIVLEPTLVPRGLNGRAQATTR